MHLWYIPVAHAGNRRSSPEEAAAVARVVGQLLHYRFRDGDGSVRPLTVEDILMVEPRLFGW